MSITPDEVEAAVRDWIHACNTGDIRRGAAMEVTGAGYGYRSPTWRDLAPAGERYLETIGQFMASLEAFHGEFEELHTKVHGDVGFAWGVYVEHFQPKGGTPERARVRFSQAMTKTDDGWKFLSFHRDIQPFDADGRYLPSLTSA